MYTKGEWYAHDGQIYPIETGKTLALIPYFDEENKEQKANAQLISASPDLLEACKVAYRALSLDSDMEEDFAPEIKQLQEAMNKAEGRS